MSVSPGAEGVSLAKKSHGRWREPSAFCHFDLMGIPVNTAKILFLPTQLESLIFGSNCNCDLNPKPSISYNLLHVIITAIPFHHILF